VDTTDPEIAEEEGVDTDRELGPRTIVLGEGHVFEPVEESIRGNTVGDSGSVVVSSEESFGEYEEEQVRTVSKDKIPEDDQYPGAQVTIDGEQGFVETIIGGRARVDFNHPLAGEDIEYEWEIIGTVDDREERASGLLEMLLEVELDVRIETDTVEEERLVEEEDEDEAEGETEADDEADDEADEEADDETDDEADEEADDETDNQADEEADDETDDQADEEADDETDDQADDEPTYETVEVERESLYIEATPQLSMNQAWMMQKQQIAQQLIDLLGVDRVVVEEVLDGGGLGGMMGGLGGGGGGDIEEALEEADIDAEDLAEEL
jgi:FKBP-type peptidyl-prolyl cis-trans isomerase SlyD